MCVGCRDYSLLDRVLGPGEYEIVFLDSSEGAYARIAETLPSRVIMCMDADDAMSLDVLSMLNLDSRTSHIPVLTCIPPFAAAADIDGAVPALRAASRDLVRH